MKSSQFFISTLKEAPTDAEVISQKLMLRAGFIKKLAAGIYTWMPMGLRSLRKVENIIRSELNAAGAIELLMPSVQPAELWQESARWEKYGAELLRLKDRHKRDFVIGPTHEEVITDVVRKELKSYKQLPLNFYQIQMKFRDEIRPRFGVMRSREFLMCDAYSFHSNFDDLQREYENMYQAYQRIFSKMGLKFRAVAADTGSIGGSGSHEFHVLADSGEDAIAYCTNPDSNYAANVELAEAVAVEKSTKKEQILVEKIHTPGCKSCQDVADFLQTDIKNITKTLVIKSEVAEKSDNFALLILRGDHVLNEIKVNKFPGFEEFRFATAEEINKLLNADAGSLGFLNLPKTMDLQKITMFIDRSVAANTAESEFIYCGANENDYHFKIKNVDFPRDLPKNLRFQIADIRNVVKGDISPDGMGELDICRGIEVGHIFQLRKKYAEALNCSFLDENGKSQITEMGCYGIGVGRVLAAAIEQNFDDKGICLPSAIAPFEVCIIPMNFHKSEIVRQQSLQIYQTLKNLGVDVLLDDRNERAGVMFADMELLGIPLRIVVGEKNLANNKLEIKWRKVNENPEAILIDNTENALKDLIKNL